MCYLIIYIKEFWRINSLNKFSYDNEENELVFILKKDIPIDVNYKNDYKNIELRFLNLKTKYRISDFINRIFSRTKLIIRKIYR